MSVALITGSCGLVGSESALFFSKKGFEIVGIDNNSRKFFLEMIFGSLRYRARVSDLLSVEQLLNPW